MLRAVMPGVLLLAAAVGVLWIVGAAPTVEWIDRGDDLAWVVGALLLIPLATAVLSMYDEWAAARRDRSRDDRRVGAS